MVVPAAGSASHRRRLCWVVRWVVAMALSWGSRPLSTLAAAVPAAAASSVAAVAAAHLRTHRGASPVEGHGGAASSACARAAACTPLAQRVCATQIRARRPRCRAKWRAAGRRGSALQTCAQPRPARSAAPPTVPSGTQRQLCLAKCAQKFQRSARRIGRHVVAQCASTWPVWRGSVGRTGSRCDARHARHRFHPPGGRPRHRP